MSRALLVETDKVGAMAGLVHERRRRKAGEVEDRPYEHNGECDSHADGHIWPGLPFGVCVAVFGRPIPPKRQNSPEASRGGEEVSECFVGAIADRPFRAHWTLA